MRSPGEKDFLKSSWFQVSCFLLHHYISSFAWNYSSHWDPSFPDSLTSRLLEAFTGWNAWELPFLEVSCSGPRALSSLCFFYLCQSRGFVTFFCTSHICSVQSRSLQPQCFFSYLMCFSSKQGPPASSTWLNTLRDRADCFYILVFTSMRKCMQLQLKVIHYLKNLIVFSLLKFFPHQGPLHWSQFLSPGT